MPKGRTPDFTEKKKVVSVRIEPHIIARLKRDFGGVQKAVDHFVYQYILVKIKKKKKTANAKKKTKKS